MAGIDAVVQNVSLQQAPDPLLSEFIELQTTKDPVIRESLICRHIPLVNRIARRIAFSRHEVFEDLSQAGYLGLIKSIDYFDPVKDVKFITYATHHIFGEIRHYLRDRAIPIKAPRWLAQLNRQLAKSMNVLIQQLKRFPTISELSKDMNIAEEGLLELLKMNHTLTSKSLDDTVYSEELLGQIDKIKSQELRTFQLPLEDKICIHQAVDTLAPIARRIIYLFFYYDLTQVEIGDKLGMSQRQVSRIMHRSLDKLKAILFKELW